MNDQSSDKLENYMEDPSSGLGLKYINTRASGFVRYLCERNIQLLCSWIPGPIGDGAETFPGEVIGKAPKGDVDLDRKPKFEI